MQVVGKDVSGSSATSGKQTCPAIPFTQGGPQKAQVLGEFTGHEFRLQIRDIAGLGDATSGCWGTPDRPIVVKVTERGTAEASFEWALGPERYSCQITLQRQSGDEPVG